MQTSRTGSSDADAEGDAPPERGTPECLDAGGALFDAVLRQGIERSVQGFVTALSDGTLIGPFPAMQRFPDLGRPLWDVFLALAEHAQLLPVVREVVILCSVRRFFMCASGPWFLRFCPPKVWGRGAALGLPSSPGCQAGCQSGRGAAPSLLRDRSIVL